LGAAGRAAGRPGARLGEESISLQDLKQDLVTIGLEQDRQDVINQLFSKYFTTIIKNVRSLDKRD
jgi:hypothetical protein